MTELNIPFGTEADEIVVDGQAVRYQHHLSELEAAYQQYETLEHELEAGRLSDLERLAAVNGRRSALRRLVAESYAAMAYRPCRCPGGEPR